MIDRGERRAVIDDVENGLNSVYWLTNEINTMQDRLDSIISDLEVYANDLENALNSFNGVDDREALMDCVTAKRNIEMQIEMLKDL